MDFLQLSFNALALGSAYALAALGFVLVLNAVGAVNFAQGDLVVAGGYLSILGLPLIAALPEPLGNLPGFLLLPLVMLVMGVIGAGLSLLVYRPLRHSPPVAVFVSTIALGIMLKNSFNALAGAAPRAGPPLLSPLSPQDDRGSLLSGLHLDLQSLGMIAAALILAGGLHLLLTRSQIGKQLRAAAQDPDMARAVGIPVDIMVLLAFGLATALAGAAGLLLSNRYFVTPDEGSILMMKAYIAVTIGGWGRLEGAVLGAFLIAGFEMLVGSLTSAPIAGILLYVMLMLILMFRPRGLLGEDAGQRA